MRKNKLMKLAVILTSVVLACSVTACGKSDSDSTENKEQTDVASKEDSDSSTYAQVTSVSDNTITAVIGEMGGANRPDNSEMPSGDTNEDGEKPSGDMKENGEMPTGDGEMPSGDGEMPSGNMKGNGEMPTGDGEMPSGDTNGGKGSMFTASDETVTFTITDTTDITVQSNDSTSDGSISDITVDSIIKYELDDSGNAVSVVIINMGNAGPAETTAE